MRCERCGRDFSAGLNKCPYCGADIHYGGKTEFYGKVVSSKLTVKDLFSDAFKSHPKGAGARMFMAGTPLTTPSPDRMLAEWDKPWLFTRVLGIGIIFALLNYFLAARLGHPLGVYLLFTLCALVFPLGVLTFFWEINIPRDIPVYRVIVIFLIGGMLSIIFTLILGSGGGGPAYLAPLTEEPAKVIALAIFVYMLDAKYIFGGLLIGSAVGAGFAAFENISYVMTYTSLELLVARSFHAFGTHAIWAAIEGGALVMVKGEEKLQLKHFIDPRFLMYLAASMAMHAVWNSDISLGYIPLFLDISCLLLTIAALFVVFSLIKKALAQILNVVDGARFRQPAPMPAQPDVIPAGAVAGATLTALSGPLSGAVFPFQHSIVIGRDPSVCNVIFPPDTPGVSRRHCTLECRSDGVYLMDHNSSSGTFLRTGIRLPANQWIAVSTPFYLGEPSILFSVDSQRTGI